MPVLFKPLTPSHKKTRSVGGTAITAWAQLVAVGVSPLTGLEPWVQLVDYEGPPATAHDLGAGQGLQSFERVANFHGEANLIESDYQLE